MPVIFTCLRLSRRVVVLARIWVIIVAKKRCQHVKMAALSNVR